MHARGSARLPRHLGEKCAFARVALDEVHEALFLIRKHNSNYKRWESPAGSEIHPNLRLRGECQELRRIRKMPLPELGNCRRRDEIDSLLPLDQQALVKLKLFHCFM